MDNEIIYLDSNVYMDYFLIREDRLRPLSDFAFEIIRRTIDCEFKIVISDLLIIELSEYISKDRIKSFLIELDKEDKLVTYNKTEETEKKARELCRKCNIPFNDALHYILALESNATYLVTRDEHFLELPQDKIKIRKPENI